MSLSNVYNVDSIISDMGFCKFNSIIFIVTMFNQFLSVSNIMLTTFVAWIPPDYNKNACNQTREERTISEEYPPHLSVMLDFNLICDYPIVQNLGSLLFFAMGLASPILLKLIDKYGRRASIFASSALHSISYASAYFITNAVGYLVFRAAIGMLQVTCGFVLGINLIESFSAKYRFYMYMIMTCAIPGGFCMCALIAYTLPNWRHMHLCLSILYLLMTCQAFWAPESLRWMSNQDHPDWHLKFQETAKRALGVEDISKYKVGNGVRIHSKQENNVKDQPAKKTWKSFELWKRICTLAFLYMTATSTFWSVNLASSDLLPGNRFVNFIILGLLHLPVVVLSCLFGRFFNRRITQWIFIIGTMICITSSFVLQVEFNLTKADAAIFWLTMFARFFSGGSFIVTEAMASELFPTEVRSTCVGFMMMAGRFSTCIATFSSLLVRSDPVLLLGVIMGLNVLAIVATVFLAETKDVPMAQTVAELEEMVKRNKSSIQSFFVVPKTEKLTVT